MPDASTGVIGPVVMFRDHCNVVCCNVMYGMGICNLGRSDSIG